ncbi:hypothetical protein DKX38_010682 [Salix brachista]|uniref:Uncharacterized protein n=1 Tax=Salix brachista TaxID=2182728 RepID=A0A5N5MGP4_9ROSI|nr:hypothetical protein DKX38_010682 [Salix brachista]
MFSLCQKVTVTAEVQVTGKAAVEMSALSKDLVLLISQFLDEEGFKETARMHSCSFLFCRFLSGKLKGGAKRGADSYRFMMEAIEASFVFPLLCLQWSPGDFGAPISHALFSCDGQMVHASFEDGVVSIFDASAQMYCLAFSSTQTIMADHRPMLLSYHDPPPLLTMTFSDGARNGKQGKGN